MKVIQLSNLVSIPLRAAQTAAAKITTAEPLSSLTIAESRDGIRYASLPQPKGWNGLSRIVAIIEAGSRYERTPDMHGITHLLRRSCGLSTMDYTAVNLTRHIQQMGAEVRCQTTREYMIYSVDVAPNLASRAGHLLADMATRAAFYDWELRDQAYKLMQMDIDVINRRKLDALAVDLLHEAAFGQHPEGTGLGNSLFVHSGRVGSHSIDAINNFIKVHFTPGRVAFAVTGTGANVDGLELCEAIHEGARLHPRQMEPLPKPKHTFIGGDIRREMTAAGVTHAVLAWPTKGRSDDSHLALSVVSSLLKAPVHSIAYGSTASPLASPNMELTQPLVSPFHQTYSDYGLFGIFVSGCSGQAVAKSLMQARRHLGQLTVSKISVAQFERAKARYKADLLLWLESQANLTDNIAIQMMKPISDAYQSPADICKAVDQLQLDTLNKVLKSVISSPQVALSVVGSDTGFVDPLPNLIKG